MTSYVHNWVIIIDTTVLEYSSTRVLVLQYSSTWVLEYSSTKSTQVPIQKLGIMPANSRVIDKIPRTVTTGNYDIVACTSRGSVKFEI